MREAIKHLDLKYKNQVLKSISISAGVAAFPDQGQEGGDILHAADMALYQAKHTGRGRVVVAAAFTSDSPLTSPEAAGGNPPAKRTRKEKQE
jgi:predicted signal transduction protein with EAL and GGDEF domain